MRQSVPFQKIALSHSLPQKQNGFTLLIVLAIMMVIALMVVATSQSTNSELFMSANSADHKYAFSLADEALRKAEGRIYEKIYQPNLLPQAGSSGYTYDETKYPTLFARLIQTYISGGASNSASPDAVAMQDPANPSFNNGKVVFLTSCFANYEQPGKTFPPAGKNKFEILRGLCAPQVVINGIHYGGTAPAWERDGVFHVGNKTCSTAASEQSVKDPNTQANSPSLCSSEEIKGLADPTKGEVYQNPRFIIEFLGLKGAIARYRITVRAWGHNPNTVVTLQSYVEVQQH